MIRRAGEAPAGRSARCRRRGRPGAPGAPGTPAQSAVPVSAGAGPRPATFCRARRPDGSGARPGAITARDPKRCRRRCDDRRPPGLDNRPGHRLDRTPRPGRYAARSGAAASPSDARPPIRPPAVERPAARPRPQLQPRPQRWPRPQPHSSGRPRRAPSNGASGRSRSSSARGPPRGRRCPRRHGPNGASAADGPRPQVARVRRRPPVRRCRPVRWGGRFPAAGLSPGGAAHSEQGSANSARCACLGAAASL